jgi:hypothetical protein
MPAVLAKAVDTTSGAVFSVSLSESELPSRLCIPHILGSMVGQVIDYGWSSCWNYANRANSWLQIDFKTRSVYLRNHSLKSHLGASNFVTDRVLEGSKDGRTWDILDRGQPNGPVGASRICTDPVSSSRCFRCIRLRQTGKTSSNYDHVLLTNIELFGMVANE